MNRELESLIWDRADERCEYCRFPKQFAELPFEVDHIIAKKHGGSTAAENLALTWNGPRIIGLTAVGRTTIDVLRINHPDAVAVRDALIEEGVFP